MSEASRALAGMEILTIEYENCVLKCAGKGLQFKLQVSSLLAPVLAASSWLGQGWRTVLMQTQVVLGPATDGHGGVTSGCGMCTGEEQASGAAAVHQGDMLPRRQGFVQECVCRPVQAGAALARPK